MRAGYYRDGGLQREYPMILDTAT